MGANVGEQRAERMEVRNSGRSAATDAVFCPSLELNPGRRFEASQRNVGVIENACAQTAIPTLIKASLSGLFPRSWRVRARCRQHTIPTVAIAFTAARALSLIVRGFQHCGTCCLYAATVRRARWRFADLRSAQDALR